MSTRGIKTVYGMVVTAMLTAVAKSQSIEVNFLDNDGHFVDSEFVNIGCAGTTNMRYIPDANSLKIREAQIAQVEDPCAMTVWCGNEVGMMTSKRIVRDTYGGDPPLVDSTLCGNNEYWALYYVALCNCDDGTGSG